MRSLATSGFWKAYHELPEDVQALARKNFRLWLADTSHPSVRFKPLMDDLWSARVGIGYRAVGRFSGPNEFEWVWIGSHADYDKI